MPFVTVDQAVTLDGFTAGTDQSLEHPFGTGPVTEVTRWMFDAAEDNADEIAGIVGADAYVMGRNMFDPGRGPFDLDWTGWWGPEPPYEAPVFVLSHHEREPLTLGATTFTFVTGGLQEAYERAAAAAGEGRLSVAGGATTVDQFLAAGLVDELRLHVAPVIAGAGVRLFAGAPDVRLEQKSVRQGELVTHLTYTVLR